MIKRYNSRSLDITFFRDDFGRRSLQLSPGIGSYECFCRGKNVALIDDVLFTGRSIRSALDALNEFWSSKHVELMLDR